jgi:hypothetical protein
MTTPSVLRFSAKNGRLPEPDQARSDGLFAPSDSRALAWRIALDTINQLIELQLVAPDAAPGMLATYRNHLDESVERFSFLPFVFPQQSELAGCQKRLAGRVAVPVWEIVEKILPPTQFYKAHPGITEACRQCGAVILDATALATITTASVNPLAGKGLAAWIRSTLSSERGEEWSPFCFHVAIPFRQWPSVARTHFGAEARCLSN